MQDGGGGAEDQGQETQSLQIYELPVPDWAPEPRVFRAD